MQQSRLDVGFRRTFRLGVLPLWPLGADFRTWLGVDSRRRMGTVVGELAQWRRLCRLGAAATGKPRLSSSLVGHVGGSRSRHRIELVHVRFGPEFRRPDPSTLPAIRAEPHVHPSDDEHHEHHVPEQPVLQWWPELSGSESSHRSAVAVLSIESRSLRRAFPSRSRPTAVGGQSIECVRAYGERELERRAASVTCPRSLAGRSRRARRSAGEGGRRGKIPRNP